MNRGDGASTRLSPRHRGLLNHSSDPFFALVAREATNKSLVCNVIENQVSKTGYDVSINGNNNQKHRGKQPPFAKKDDDVDDDDDPAAKPAPSVQDKLFKTGKNGDPNPFFHGFTSVPPHQIHSLTPAGGRPITPAGGRPITPAGGRPITPAGGHPITSVGGRPIIPQSTENLQNSFPEELKSFGSDGNFPRRIDDEGDEDGDEGDQQRTTTFNMRLANLSNFPVAQISHRSTFRSQNQALSKARRGCVTSASSSLDLLRHNLQKQIDAEIRAVIAKYFDRFFQPSIRNIRENNGKQAVSETHVMTLCRQILEESKKMYASPLAPAAASATETGFGARPDRAPNSFGPRRRKREPRGASPMWRQRGVSPMACGDASSGDAPDLDDRRRLDFPDSDSEDDTKKPSQAKRRKGNAHATSVKREGPRWDPDRLTTDTKFMMGAKANKALGLGNTRGRLYTKHPELFKYSGDQEDKQWLYEKSLLTATGGKAYMLLVDDVRALAQSLEYKHSPDVLLEEVAGFSVPDSILRKMRAAMHQSRTATPIAAKDAKPPAPVVTPPPKIRPLLGHGDHGDLGDEDCFGRDPVDPAALFASIPSYSDVAPLPPLPPASHNGSQSPVHAHAQSPLHVSDLFQSDAADGVDQIPGLSDLLCHSQLEEDDLEVDGGGASGAGGTAFLVGSKDIKFLANDNEGVGLGDDVDASPSGRPRSLLGRDTLVFASCAIASGIPSSPFLIEAD